MLLISQGVGVLDELIQDVQKVSAPDDYSTKNTQKYFKQFQSLTMVT
jgi:hypothetical protein